MCVRVELGAVGGDAIGALDHDHVARGNGAVFVFEVLHRVGEDGRIAALELDGTLEQVVFVAQLLLGVDGELVEAADVHLLCASGTSGADQHRDDDECNGCAKHATR